MQLLAKLHPEIAFTLYLAENITAKDLVSILEPLLANEMVKLHSAGGKSVKQAGKKKTLLDVLSNALPQDRLADLQALTNAASVVFQRRLKEDMLTKVQESLGMPASQRKNLQSRWDSYFPMMYARQGRYSSMYDSITKCEAQFRLGGGRQNFRIRFNVRRTEIDGKSIRLPTNLVWTDHGVLLENHRGIVIIDSRGGAVMFGNGGMEPFMDCWNKDALNTTDIIGRACSSCIWCGRTLTDPTSVNAHAGPTCSTRYRPVMRHAGGPFTGTSVDVPPPSTLTPLTMPSGLVLSIPQRVIDNSPFLQGLLDLDTENSTVDATKLLEVSQEALALLDEILGDTTWVPESLESLEVALPVADKLGLVELTTRLEQWYTTMCTSLDHWPGWVEIVKQAAAKERALAANGEVTPFTVSKRKRGMTAHLDFIAAIRANDTAKMHELWTEYGAVACAPPNKPTNAERELCRTENMAGALMNCTAEVLRKALEYGVNNCNDIKNSWRRTGHFEAYVDHGFLKMPVWRDALLSVFCEGSVEDLSMMWTKMSQCCPAAMTAINVSTYKGSLQSKVSTLFIWLFEREIIPKTETFFHEILSYDRFSSASATWFVQDCLPLFQIPPSSRHLEEAMKKRIFPALLRVPDYAAMVDADFVASFVRKIEEFPSYSYETIRANVRAVFDIFSGPLEPRHGVKASWAMEIIAAKHTLLPEFVNCIDICIFLELAPDIDVGVVVGVVEDPDRALSDIVYRSTHTYTGKFSDRALEAAEGLARVRKDRAAKLPGNVYHYGRVYYESNSAYKKLMDMIHDVPTVHF